MPWLTVLIFLPLVGIPVLALWRGRATSRPGPSPWWSRWPRSWSRSGCWGVRPSVAGYQLVEHVDWLPSAGLSYLVGVDGFSVWLVVLTAFMTPVAIVSSWGVSHRVRLFMALTLLLETAIVGSFLALDLLLFFVFFEALLVPMFLVIGMWGSARRVYASLKFFLYTMAGSAFLLLAIVYLWFQTSAAARPRQLRHPSDGTALARHHDAALAVPGLLHRVRGQGADLPAAHVAARRAHRGADERLDRPGRRCC